MTIVQEIEIYLITSIMVKSILKIKKHDWLCTFDIDMKPYLSLPIKIKHSIKGWKKFLNSTI